MAAGWRSRAACKLAEIDDRLHILRRARSILDIGAAPGGWLQVALERAAVGARIVGVDLLPIKPLDGVCLLTGDIGDARIKSAIAAKVSAPIDLVMCDAAPNLSGFRARDEALCEQLHAEVFEICVAYQAKVLLLKGFSGTTIKKAEKKAKLCFAKTSFLHLDSIRKHSSEVYLIAKQAFHSYNK